MCSVNLIRPCETAKKQCRIPLLIFWFYAHWMTIGFLWSSNPDKNCPRLDCWSHSLQNLARLILNTKAKVRLITPHKE